MSNSVLLILLLLIYSTLGSVLLIFDKYLDQEGFSHPFLLNFLMFFAEIFALPFFYFLLCRRKKNQNQDLEEDKERSEEGNEPNLTLCQIFIFLVPSFLDTIATFSINICLIFFPSNFGIMFKGILLIIITCIISRFFLKNYHTWDHYLAILISLIGFIISGISSISTDNNNDNDNNNIVLGIITLVFSIICQSFQINYEEHYMRKFRVHPFLCVGIEGIFGFILNLFLCISFYYIKCGDNISRDFCTKDDNDIYRVENAIYAFEQLNNKTILILVLFVFVILIPYNIFGMSITRYGGALTKSLIENFKSFLSWLIFLFPFHSETLKEDFDVWKLVGLVLILLSIFTYFGLFKIEEKIMISRKMKALNNMEDISTSGINSVSRSSLSSDVLDKSEE